VYQLRPPHPDLAPLIEHYWFVTAEDGPVDLRVDVFVDGRPDLIFNFGAPYSRTVIGGPTTEHLRSNLDAQRMVPIRIVQRGAVHIVGVRFRLGGLGPLAHQDLRPFSGKTPAPWEVFGPELASLEAAVRTTSMDGAAAAMDAWFRGRLRRDDGRTAFELALRQFVASGGAATVERSARAAGCSIRQVERLFAEQVGLSPKAVARVLRFQAALGRLMHDPQAALVSVAAEAGYYDQAHFIRDFRAMTGGVPRGYRGYFPPEGPADFAPNVVVFVQDSGRGPVRG
jgi:AraC-like DNA-binding protein